MTVLPDRRLARLDVSASAEQLYRALLGTSGADLDRLGAAAGLPPDRTTEAAAELVRLGLVEDLGDGRVLARDPDVLSARLRAEQAALDEARAEVTHLVEEHRATARRYSSAALVEVVDGAAALRDQLRVLQDGAGEEVLWFCRAGHVAMASGDNAEEFSALSRGVAYRAVYEQAMLEEPGTLDTVAAGVRAGELARAAPVLPVRLAVFDRQRALLPLVPVADPSGVRRPTTALVHPSPLLDALVTLFEDTWVRATPLQVTDEDGHGVSADHGLDPDQRRLLSLVVAGLPDRAIARDLGLSLRTLQRRVSALQQRAGAGSRTQLVWHAARHGWLD